MVPCCVRAVAAMAATATVMICVAAPHAKAEGDASPTPVGPSGPVGPDVPLTETEERQFAERGIRVGKGER